MPTKPTSTISSAMLIRQQTMRYIMGLRESPIARSMPEPMLYRRLSITPAKYMRMYSAAPSITSAVVPMASSAQREPAIPTAISTAPPSSDSAIDVCTARLTLCSSPLPKNCDMMTVAPEDRPTKKPTSRLIIVPVAPPTAASACLPR